MTASIDGQALLASILANPECDTARLVYADWLQEQGQEERAEFIRLSVRRAGFRCAKNKHPSPCKSRGPGAAGGPHHLCQSLDAALDALMPAVARGLIGGYLDWHTHCSIVGSSEVQYDSAPGNKSPQDESIIVSAHRGLVSNITMSFADLLTHAGKLFAVNPIERVAVRGAEPHDNRQHGESGDFAGPKRLEWVGLLREHNRVGVYNIPRRVFAHMPTQLPHDHGQHRFHPTREAALDALSAACVAFGRAEARKRRAVDSEPMSKE